MRTIKEFKESIKSIKEHLEYANNKLRSPHLSVEDIDFWMMFRRNEIETLRWFEVECGRINKQSQ